MTEPHNGQAHHRRVWPEPQVFDTLQPAAYRQHLGPSRLAGPGTCGIPGESVRQPPAEIIAHLVVALSRYLRHLHANSGPVPAQLERLAMFLAAHASPCPDVPPLDRSRARPDSSTVPSRLLLTKREAAEQLGVSVRTIERLISAGRLPLVHVEGAARVRVADLETYVQGLEADDRANPSSPK